MSLLENSLENVLKNNSIDSSQLITRLVKVEAYYNDKRRMYCWRYHTRFVDEAPIIVINTKIVLKICDILIKNKALLAGGSVLGCFSDFKNNNLDLDIYVNEKNAMTIYNDLSNIGYNNIKNLCLAPPYDQSFFRKNHILSRIRLENEDFIPIDLMIIPDNISLVSVVTNFDLSFCEIWFDGQNVYAVDPEGIKNKQGVLKPDYNEALFKYFNKFITNRIKKYGKRGFKISYSSPFSVCRFLYKAEEIKDMTIPNGTIKILNETTNKYVYPEEWVVKFVLKKFYTLNCRKNFNLYYHFTLKEFTWQNLFSMLKRYYHITPFSYGIYSYQGSNLESIPMPPEYRWINPENPRFPEDASPEFKQKRVDFKVKLLIKYLILNIFTDHDESIWRHMEKLERWIEYINKILNGDIENEEGRIINGENFYVNFIDYKKEDLTPDQAKLLTDILYVENILNPLSFKDLDLFTYYSILNNYFLRINQRSSISYYKNNYLIPNDFEILDIESFEETSMNEWLAGDPTNLIFLYNSTQTDAINGIKGIGLSKNALYQLHAKLIVECKKSNIGLAVYQDNVFLNKIYNVLTVGDSLNNGILLSKLNCVKDEVEKEGGNRIFYLTEERLLKSIAGLSSVIYYNEYDLNIHGSYRNLVSAAHCGDGQETRVYDEIFIIDKSKLVSVTEFDRVISSGAIENNIKDTEPPPSYTEISSRISAFLSSENTSSFKLLMNSIRDGEIDIATKIIKNNDKYFLNMQDDDGNTPLIFAVDLGIEYIELIKLLLKKKVNVNTQNKLGETALMIASESFEANIIDLLVRENDADITLVNNNGNTALLSLAYKYESLTLKETSYKKKSSIEYSIHVLLDNSKKIIDVQNNIGETALIVLSRNIQIFNGLESILRYKPNPNIQDNNGYTALMNLTKLGSSVGVKMLLYYGVDPDINLVNRYGDTALIIASFYGFHDIIKLLLDRPDIKLNIQNNEGYTALHYAVSMENIDIIKSLIKAGANPDIKNNDGQSPSDIALDIGIDLNKILSELEESKENTYVQEEKVGESNVEILLNLIKNNEGEEAALEFIDNLTTEEINQEYNLMTPLTLAIIEDKVNIFNKLIMRSDIDINKKNGHGYTPILYAIKLNRFTDMLPALLNHNNLDIDMEEDIYETTPIYQAVQSNNLNIVNEILTLNPNLNILSYGETPLHLAVRKNNIDIVKALVGGIAKIDINKLNSEGKTPLDLAYENGYTDIVEYLRTQSEIENFEEEEDEEQENIDDDYMDPTISDDENEEEYTENDYIETTNYDDDLQANINNTDSPSQLRQLYLYIMDRKTEDAIDLINIMDIDTLNIQDIDGYTPLVHAINRHANDIAIAIINKGVNLDLQDIDGYTSLMHAIIDRHANDIVIAIINKGVNLDLQDIDGYTALSRALTRNNIELVNILLEAGANSTIQDNYGNSPADVLGASDSGENYYKGKYIDDKNKGKNGIIYTQDDYTEQTISDDEDSGDYYEGRYINEKFSPKRQR